MAALAYGTALALALIVLIATAEINSSALAYCLTPIILSALAVTSRARQIVWTALGVCLAVGIVGFFSIGLIVSQIGICLFTWWLLSSRRAGRQVIIATDLTWELIGFVAIWMSLGLA
jgi:hypothetical protein